MPRQGSRSYHEAPSAHQPYRCGARSLSCGLGNNCRYRLDALPLITIVYVPALRVTIVFVRALLRNAATHCKSTPHVLLPATPPAPPLGSPVSRTAFSHSQESPTALLHAAA